MTWTSGTSPVSSPPARRSASGALLVAALGLALGIQATRGEPLHVDFDTRGHNSPVASEDGGIYGAFGKFDGNDVKLRFALEEPVGPAMTLAAWVRGRDWPAGEGDGGFGPNAPATLVALGASDVDAPVANLRVRKGRLELAVATADKTYGTATAAMELPLNEWLHVAAVHDGKHIRLYVDGEKVVDERVEPMHVQADAALVGAAGARRHVGDLDEVIVVGRALSDEQVGRLALGEVNLEALSDDAK